MEILDTHHIALVTSNFERLREFYTEILGLPVVGAFAGYNIIFLKAGGTTIELIERTGVETAVTGTFDHLAFDVADVDAAVAELEAKGVSFHISPRNFPEPAEVRIAFFRDPDGNILELVQALGARYPQRGM